MIGLYISVSDPMDSGEGVAHGAQAYDVVQR
jgi:hypothetical protein